MPRPPQELHEKMAIGSERDKANKALGKAGENKACAYLKKFGYKILERNYKSPVGEVDVIAQKGEVLAFIEVKTRLSDSYGIPSEAVNFKRRQKYLNAAKYYFYGRPIDCTVRFDIIEIYRGEVNHIKNAFY